MPDIGFTHVALPVTSLETSLAFYSKYASLDVVHRRQRQTDPSRQVAWLSDGQRPFVLVLVEFESVDIPLGPFAHLGIACTSIAEVDRLAEEARLDGMLSGKPTEMRPPVGYVAMLSDPDGHTVEISFGQEVTVATEETT